MGMSVNVEKMEHLKTIRDSSSPFFVILEAEACINEHEAAGKLQYNDSLLKMLMEAKVEEVYLLPFNLLKDFQRKLSDGATRDRLNNIEKHLKTFNINVKGVITLMDSNLGQELGLYYKNHVVLYEKLEITGEKLTADKNTDVFLKEGHEEALAEKKSVDEISRNLFIYILDQLNKSLPKSNSGIFVFHKTENLIQDQSILKDESLCPILVKPTYHSSVYSSKLVEAINKSLFRSLNVQLNITDRALNEKKEKEDEEVSSLRQKLMKVFADQSKLSSEQFQNEINQLRFKIGLFLYNRKIHKKKEETIDMRLVSLQKEREKNQELISGIQGIGKQADKINLGMVSIYGLKSPLCVDKLKALALLSIDEKGDASRTVNSGNGLVSTWGNVYFKRDPIDSFFEQAVYQLSALLGGDIITPTKLLLVHAPELPAIDLSPVQASLAVTSSFDNEKSEAPSLEEVLFVPIAFRKLTEIFRTEDKCIKGLEIFLELGNIKSLEEWQKTQEIPNAISREEQCKLLLDRLLKLPKEQRPTDLRIDLKRDDERKKVIKLMTESKALRGNIFLLLRWALEKDLSGLIENITLVELMNYLRLPSTLKALFPGYSIQEILIEAPKLISYFDKENLNKHIVLALLSGPGDHKGDNFKVSIIRDDKKKITNLKIIGIDNDRAFNNAVLYVQPEEDIKATREIGIKTILFAEEEWLNIEVTEAMRKTLLSKNASIMILQWLEAMVHYVREYDIYFKRYPFLLQLFSERRTNKTFIMGGRKQFSVKSLLEVLDRLEKIQKFLIKNNAKKITLGQLIEAVDPITAWFYKQLRLSSGANSLRAIADIYDKGSNTKVIEYTLSGQLEEVLPNGVTLKKFLETIVPIEKNLVDFKDLLLEQININFSYEFLEARPRDYLVDSLDNKITLLEVIIALRKIDIVYPIENLTLDSSVFAAVYEKHTHEFIELLKDCNEVYLSFRDFSTTSPINHPFILFYALKFSKKPNSIIEGLLAYGASVSNRDPYCGSTALHIAAEQAPEVIPTLVEANIEVEAKDVWGKTALDRAIDSVNLIGIHNLLLAGSECCLSTNMAKGLIQFYSVNFRELSEKLLMMNGKLSWDLILKSLEQEKIVAEGLEQEKALAKNIQIKRLHCNQSNLVANVYHQWFKDPKWIVRDNHKLGGTRSITLKTIVQNASEVNFRIRERPQFPGREIMVERLAHKLFGPIVPSIELLSLSYNIGGEVDSRNISYPVLVRKWIEGDSLSTVLQNYPERLEKIEDESFSQAIILAMLINPEDGRPNHYLLKPFFKGKEILYKIYSVNNDRSFVKPVALNPDGSEFQDRKNLYVKTTLFCLEHMKRPIHPRVIERLKKMESPREFLEKWINELNTYQDELNLLFELNRTKKDSKINEEQRYINQGIKIKIEFRSSIVTDLYQKLTKMVYFLKINSTMTHLDLLKRIIPSIGFRYSDLFHLYNNPQERYSEFAREWFTKEIIESEDKKRKVEKYFSKTSFEHVFHMTLGQFGGNAKALGGIHDSPIQVLKNLETIDDKHNFFQKLIAQVQNGDLEKFSRPNHREFREQLINGDDLKNRIDFGAMKLPNHSTDLEKQAKVLKAFNGVSFSRLHLQDCEALTEKTLKALLEYSKGLVELRLKNCRNIKEIDFVEQLCPDLEILEINNMSIEKISGSFPKLKTLYIRECEKLSSCEIKSLLLQELEIKWCQKLSKILIPSLKLITLNIEDCRELRDYQLMKGIASTSVKEISIKGCALIKYGSFYEKYPNLIMLPLYELGSEFVSGLETQLQRTYWDLKLTSFGLHPKMLSEIVNSLIERIRNIKDLFFGLDKLSLKEILFLRNEFGHGQECIYEMELAIHHRLIKGLNSDNKADRLFASEALISGMSFNVSEENLYVICKNIMDDVSFKKQIGSIIRTMMLNTKLSKIGNEVLRLLLMKLNSTPDVKWHMDIVSICFDLLDFITDEDRIKLTRTSLTLIDDRVKGSEVLFENLKIIMEKEVKLSSEIIQRMVIPKSNDDDNDKVKKINLLAHGLRISSLMGSDRKAALKALLTFWRDKSDRIKKTVVEELNKIYPTNQDKDKAEEVWICDELGQHLNVSNTYNKDKIVCLLVNLTLNFKLKKEVVKILNEYLLQKDCPIEIIKAVGIFYEKINSLETQELAFALLKLLEQPDPYAKVKALFIFTNRIKSLPIDFAKNLCKQTVHLLKSALLKTEEEIDNKEALGYLVDIFGRLINSNLNIQLRNELLSLFESPDSIQAGKIVILFRNLLLKNTSNNEEWIISAITQMLESGKCSFTKLDALELLLLIQESLPVVLQKIMVFLLQQLLQSPMETNVNFKLKHISLFVQSIDLPCCINLREALVNKVVLLGEEVLTSDQEQKVESELMRSSVRVVDLMSKLLDKKLSLREIKDVSRILFVALGMTRTLETFLKISEFLLDRRLFAWLEDPALKERVVQIGLQELDKKPSDLRIRAGVMLGKALLRMQLTGAEKEKIIFALKQARSNDPDKKLLSELHKLFSINNLIEYLDYQLRSSFHRDESRLYRFRNRKLRSKGTQSIVPTMGDGNCALNAIALGVSDLILQDKKEIDLTPVFCQRVSEVLNLKTDDKKSIKEYLKALDNEQRQKRMSPALRRMAVKYIVSNYDHYKFTFQNGLLAAFDEYCSGRTDETYCVHQHIRTQFDVMREKIQNARKAFGDKKESKDNKELLEIQKGVINDILTWWENEGKKIYFKELSLSAGSASEIHRWASDVEIHALGCLFGMNIKVIRENKSYLCGVGYGLIKGLSYEDEQHLSSCGIGSRYEDLGFRIELSNRVELDRILKNQKLSPAELKWAADDNIRGEVLKFLNGQDNVKIKEIEDLKLFSEKLKSLGVFILRGKDKGYRNADANSIKYLIKPFRPEIYTKVISHFNPMLPCFLVKHSQNHWSYIRETETNLKISDFNFSSSAVNEYSLLYLFQQNKNDRFASGQKIELRLLASPLHDSSGKEVKVAKEAALSPSGLSGIASGQGTSLIVPSAGVPPAIPLRMIFPTTPKAMGISLAANLLTGAKFGTGSGIHKG